jgi:signal transduction histidine kinase
VGIIQARNQPDVWGWQATALIVTIVLVPQVVIQFVAPELRSLSGAAWVSGVMGVPLIGFAAVGVYLYAWLTRWRGIARLAEVPHWAAYRLVLAATAVCLNAATTSIAGSAEVLAGAIGLITGILGAVLLVDTSLALLRHGAREDRQVVSALNDELVVLAAEGRANRETLHEIRGSMAGITSAARLIRSGSLPQSVRRDQLEVMLAKEADRLERMVRKTDDVPAAEERRKDWVDLDETIGPVVVAQRARGRVIRWKPTGQKAQGRQDDIAQVINILLENAAQHAPSAPTDIDVRRRKGTIEIEVSDQGPGVPPAMQDRLFDWGARGPHSSGEGIGLNVAHRLLDDADASLHLATSDSNGARFVMGLQHAGEIDDAADSA